MDKEPFASYEWSVSVNQFSDLTEHISRSD